MQFCFPERFDYGDTAEPKPTRKVSWLVTKD